MHFAGGLEALDGGVGYVVVPVIEVQFVAGLGGQSHAGQKRQKRFSAKDAKKPEGKPKNPFMDTLNKSFDKLRTNGKLLIPLVVSLSNHERNQFAQRFLRFLKKFFASLRVLRG